jgi:two-component system phosphate regulon sensor histidine kinase PhoR
MGKKTILVIVSLLGLAVVSLVWMQMRLIHLSIGENEKRFDNSVFTALSAVANRLREADQRNLFNYSMNGFVANYYKTAGDPNAAPLPAVKDRTNDEALLDQLMLQFTDTCNCLNCNRIRLEKGGGLPADIYQDPDIPVAERIEIAHLRAAIEQELHNNGIHTDYLYGVYSRAQKGFVIYNGNFVASDGRGGERLPNAEAVMSSKYRATLFTNSSNEPEGLLMLYFPSRSSVLWSSLWLHFTGALLFALLIVLLFGYTIVVIYRQKRVSEMKNDFINNMTHEFKTPIATISLASDSILSPKIAGNPEKVARFAHIIKQENKRMNSQVEKVLQMALIDRSNFKLRFSQVDLHDVIRGAVENIGLQVERRQGKVHMLLQARQPVIEADLTHVSSIINNLLDNANKYSADAPDITVSTHNVAGGVEVVIADKGIGMTKEDRKLIFDKFYRVHTGNRHDVKGFGLGLSYVKAMMLAHRGHVDVKSELGKGSSFTLFFPFKAAAGNRAFDAAEVEDDVTFNG